MLIRVWKSSDSIARFLSPNFHSGLFYFHFYPKVIELLIRSRGSGAAVLLQKSYRTTFWASCEATKETEGPRKKLWIQLRQKLDHWRGGESQWNLGIFLPQHHSCGACASLARAQGCCLASFSLTKMGPDTSGWRSISQTELLFVSWGQILLRACGNFWGLHIGSPSLWLLLLHITGHRGHGVGMFPHCAQREAS